MWFLSGLLTGVGIVGLLTGLPLALAGVALLVRSYRRTSRGAWWFLVGLGMGAAILTIDDVLTFANDRCIGQAGRGFECPAAWAHEIFWVGIVAAVLGLLMGVVSKVAGGSSVPTQEDPVAFHSRS